MEASIIIIPIKYLEVLERDELFHQLIFSCKIKIERIYEHYHCNFFPEFTNHGIHHVNELLRSTLDVIHESSFAELDSKNISSLILSVFVHDIGMSLNVPTFSKMLDGSYPKGQLDTQDYKQLWESYLEESLKWSLEDKLGIIGNTDFESQTNIDIKSDDSSIKRLIGEFIRRHHPRIAYDVLEFGYYLNDENIKLLDFNNFQYHTSGISKKFDFAKITGLIARSHGIDIRYATDILKNMDTHNWMDYIGIKTVYLMAILRIADYLLIDSNRIFKAIFRFKEFKSPVSRNEFSKHISIIKAEKSRLDSESIRFIVDEQITNNQYVDIINLLLDIQNELDKTWAILSEAYSLHDDLARLKLSYRRVASNILENKFGSNSPIVFGESKMEMTPSLIPLLARNLYTSKWSAVRELIQNSVDACIIRQHFESDYEPVVTINLYKNELYIEDNGIGMDHLDIKNYLLKIGRSSKIKKYNFNNIVGQFGIGILSAFNIGESIEITTKRKDSKYGYQFSLDQNLKIDKNISINKVSESNLQTGTTIKVILLDSDFLYKKDPLGAYFHYVGGVNLRYLYGYKPLRYKFGWREIKTSEYIIHWNYRNETWDGKIDVNSNYLNGFLVKKFNLFSEEWLSHRYVFNIYDNKKNIEINLSREVAICDINDELACQVKQDIAIDYYLYILALTDRHIYYYDRGFNLNVPNKLKNNLLLFKAGYSLIGDYNFKDTDFVIVVNTLNKNLIKDALSKLPDNAALTFELPHKCYDFKFIIDEKYNKKEPSDKKKFKKYESLCQMLGTDLIQGICSYTTIRNANVSLAFLEEERIKNNSFRQTFNEKLIPYNTDERNDCFKKFISEYSTRYEEILRFYKKFHHHSKVKKISWPILPLR